MDDHFFTPANLMIFISICLMLVAITGCIGAIKESTMLVNIVSKTFSYTKVHPRCDWELLRHKQAFFTKFIFIFHFNTHSLAPCCSSYSAWNWQLLFLLTLCTVKYRWCWFVQWMMRLWFTRKMTMLPAASIFYKRTWVDFFLWILFVLARFLGWKMMA